MNGVPKRQRYFVALVACSIGLILLVAGQQGIIHFLRPWTIPVYMVIFSILAIVVIVVSIATFFQND
jgi:hypothetical protein